MWESKISTVDLELHNWILVKMESDSLSVSYSQVVKEHLRAKGTLMVLKQKRMRFLASIVVKLERLNMFDHNSIIDMLFSGVIQIAQKVATQHGACHALTAFWKNAMGTYHENGKVRIII